MKSLYILSSATQSADIQFQWVEVPMPILKPHECLVQVVASGVNPSDALAAMGYFKHAVFPRRPGRDFAGVIVDGPVSFMGKKVWGTGGAAGISFDGTQADYIVLPTTAVAEVPQHMDLITAGAQPLPYVTAYYSLVHCANICEEESVLVIGALGQVGRAAMSICQWKKCHAIALVRGEIETEKAKQLGWNAINSNDKNLSEKILAANHDKPISVILNSVGNIYWQDFMKCLATFGRIVTIGARENTREVMINLFELYRANQSIMGVNTVALDFIKNAVFMNELRSGFESKQLKPLELDPKIYTPQEAKAAYQCVAEGSSKNRVVIRFN